MSNNLAIASVAICIPVVVSFGIIAILHARLLPKDDSTIFFLTARNSFGAWQLAGSFFAATIGSWILFVPADVVVDHTYGSGWLGLVSYSLSTGGAIALIAFLASFVKDKYPDILSLGHYARLRLGPAAEIYVTLVVFGNLILSMAVEYTAIGVVFSKFLGVPAIFPILTVGFVTLIYTATGGLYVSILTDQYQSMFTLLLLSIIMVYIGVTWNADLGPLPPHLALNQNGYMSLITLSCSLISSLFFSDAIWQRVWAAKDSNSLKNGGVWGGVVTTVVVFLFGLAALLASWRGYNGPSSDAFFAILDPGNGTPDWILIIVSLVAITMNESAIDSLQNAISGTLISFAISFGVKLSLNWARVVMVLINVPIILLGLQGIDIKSLFLFANMLTTFSALPLILSIFSKFDRYVNQSSLFFSYVFSFLSLVLYGYLQTGSVVTGLYTYFYKQYDGGAFAIALVGSIMGLALWCGLEQFILSTDYGRHKFAKKHAMEERVFLDLKDFPLRI